MSIPYFAPGLLADPQEFPGRPGYTPMAAPLPAPPAVRPITMPTSPKRTSLFDRFKQALLPTPPGMGGLLSPDDEGAARHAGMLDVGLGLLDASHGAPGENAPSVTQALARGIHAGRAGMESSAQQSVQGGLLQDDLERKQHAEQMRQQVLQKFPPRPGETQEQAMQRLTQTYQALLSAGDMEGAGKMSEVIKTIMAREPKTPTAPPIHDLGDRVGVFDLSGNLIRTIPKGIPPKTPAEVDASRKFDATETNAILDDFRTQTKDYDEAKSGYEVLKGALTNPGIAKPFAVLDAYARVVNPGAAVRMGTMAILQEMGSVDDRIRRWLSMTQNGQWPPDMVASIKNTVDGIMAQHAKSYAETRNRTILRAKRAGLKGIDELLGPADFGGATPPPASTAGSADAVRKFLKK